MFRIDKIYPQEIYRERRFKKGMLSGLREYTFFRAFTGGYLALAYLKKKTTLFGFSFTYKSWR